MRNLQTERPSPRASGNPGRRRIASGGFTLLEVIMGLALISLLFGGVYGIANASMDLGRSVTDNRLRELRVSGLVNFLRSGMGSLPPGSRLELPSAGRWDAGEGRIRVVDPAGIWAWSGATGAADAVDIFPEAGEKGIDLVVAHLRVAEGGRLDSEDAAFEEFSRTRLVSLESFRWEFFEAESGDWLLDWDGAKGRPSLLAAHFALPGDPEVRRHVFAVSPEVKAGGTREIEGRRIPNEATNIERGAGS